MEAVRRASGYPVYGILGMDFLAKFAIQLDPDENKLRIYSGPSRFSGKAIPIRRAASKPFVTGIFPGQQKQDLLLDTGYYASASVGLSADRFELLRRSTGSRALQRRVHIATATGDATSGGRVIVVPFLSIGDATALNVQIADCGSDLLGLSFFARFKATFDFPNAKLYLEPGRRLHEADRPDRSGLHLWKVDGYVTVRSVDEGSPATAAGIEPGDVIVEANGIDASKSTMHRLRLLLRCKGESIRLTLRRRREKQCKTLVL